MIYAIKALLQSEPIIFSQIFHQPADFPWQKQMKVVLIYLNHKQVFKITL